MLAPVTQVSVLGACPDHLPPNAIPMGACEAGFPSPAQDYVEGRLDLNEKLIQHKEATFFVRVQGHSMTGAGIRDGDLLVVDRAMRPDIGKIVVAEIEGGLAVKTLAQVNGEPYLASENPAFRPIPIDPDAGITIWGVVTYCIHKVAN